MALSIYNTPMTDSLLKLDIMDYTVPATRFRRELNKWIRLAHVGGRITVTLHERPIAIIGPAGGDGPTLENRLTELRKLRGRLAHDDDFDRESVNTRE